MKTIDTTFYQLEKINGVLPSFQRSVDTDEPILPKPLFDYLYNLVGRHLSNLWFQGRFLKSRKTYIKVVVTEPNRKERTFVYVVRKTTSEIIRTHIIDGSMYVLEPTQDSNDVAQFDEEKTFRTIEYQDKDKNPPKRGPEISTPMRD